MLSKQECYKILLDMRADGVNVNKPISQLASASTVPPEVIKFINENRNLAITEFYRVLRKKSNSTKNKLYKEIVTEVQQPMDKVKALSSFITQGVIAGEKLELKERENFFKALRLKECAKALMNYFENSDIQPLLEMVLLIKNDIKIFENKEIKNNE